MKYLEKLNPEELRVINKVNQAKLNKDYFPFRLGYFDETHYLFRATDFFPHDRTFAKRDVQYPPSDKLGKVKLGRCNFEQQAIFYAASNCAGALIESSSCFRGETKGTQFFYISRWKVVKPFSIIDFYFKTITEDTNPKLKEEIENAELAIRKIEPNCDSAIELLRFCGDRFAISGNSGYPFTANLSNLVYNQSLEGRTICGVTYTGAKEDMSIGKCWENYSNIALVPELIENGTLVLLDVLKVRVTSDSEIFINLESATKKSEIITSDIVLFEEKMLSEYRVNEVLKNVLESK